MFYAFMMINMNMNIIISINLNSFINNLLNKRKKLLLKNCQTIFEEIIFCKYFTQFKKKNVKFNHLQIRY